MFTPTHPHGCLLALHGGRQAGENSSGPGIFVHAQRAPCSVLAAQQKRTGTSGTSSQRFQTRVKNAIA